MKMTVRPVDDIVFPPPIFQNVLDTSRWIHRSLLLLSDSSVKASVIILSAKSSDPSAFSLFFLSSPQTKKKKSCPHLRSPPRCLFHVICVNNADEEGDKKFSEITLITMRWRQDERQLSRLTVQAG